MMAEAMLTNEEVYKLGETFLRASDCKRFILLYWIEKSEDGTEIHFDFKHRTTPKRHRISGKVASYESLEALAWAAGQQAAHWARDEDQSHLLSGQKMMGQLCTLHQ